MPRTDRKKRRLKMLHYYLIVAALVVAGVVVFANTFVGGLGESFGKAEEPSPSHSLVETEALVPEEPVSEGAPNMPQDAEAAASSSGRLLPYRSDKLWGYKNTSGQIVIPARFSAALEFDGDVALAAVNSTGAQLYGLLDRQGKWVIEPLWEDAARYSEGYAAIKDNGRWGFISVNGVVAVPPEYEQVGRFSEGLARVKLDGKWGYIDKNGELVISAVYSTAEDFSEGLAFVINEDASVKRPIIDTQGEQAARLKTATGTHYSSKLAVVDLGNGKYGYVGIDGKLAIDTTFQQARDFSDENLAPVMTDGEWIYINEQGYAAFDTKYKDAQSFSEGLAAAMPIDGEKYGYFDANGNTVVEPAYDEAWPFSEGYALVRRGIEYGVIDGAGIFKLLYMDTE